MSGLPYERYKNTVYLRIIDSIYDGVCIYDSMGEPIYANAAHMKNVGFEEGEFWKINLYDMMKMDPPMVSRAVNIIVLENKRPHSSIVDYYRTGKSCLITAMPIYLENGEMLVTSIARDLTELIEMQRQVELSLALQETYENRIKSLENKLNPAVIRTKSKKMSNIWEKAERVLNVTAPVLLLGETGVGKDFLAKYLHENSDMPGPFIKVNCGAIPDNLLESELFGYEAGAFTGANKSGKAGLIELADNGTLYLDEIADLPLVLQVKLLAVIQDRQVARVGSTRQRPINFRVIAATNADLKARIASGQFREDLYYRLNVISFQLPSLRERPEDIFPLADFFLKELNAQYHKQAFFSPQAIRLMNTYAWPGNIRELKNTLERVVILMSGSCITEELLSQNLLFRDGLPNPQTSVSPSLLHSPGTLKERVSRFEQEAIADAILQNGTLGKAAQALGIDVSTLVRKKRRGTAGS